MPRVDSASVFGRLLDADRGGFCTIRVDEDVPVSRRYLDEGLVLETTFRGPSGEARLLDASPSARAAPSGPTASSCGW
jgi:hypothetical protein